jgi:cullin 3
MVLYKKGDQLYDGVNQLVAESLDKLASEEVIPVFPSTGSDILQQSQEGEILLKALRSIWDDHLGNMLKLSQILKYMVSEFRSPYLHVRP